MRRIYSACLHWLTLGCVLLCALTPAKSSAQTNSYWTALGIDPAIYGTPFSISLFSPKNGEDGARTWSQTKSLFFYGLGVVAVLYVLPSDVTGWERDNNFLGNWVDNVTAGPVWDRDNSAYNYIGHTYSGGVYYQVARKSGYRQWDAFIYTTLMSTFFWEYGVEAFAEIPSIQDLVVTPLMGWVYGEWAYKTDMKIRNRDNEVMGSKVLGGISLFLLDPVDVLEWSQPGGGTPVDQVRVWLLQLRRNTDRNGNRPYRLPQHALPHWRPLRPCRP